MDFLSLDVRWLPAVNAMLNTSSVVFLILAFFFIRQKNVWWHRANILLALGCSAMFLTSYLIYHSIVGHVPYGGSGWVRALYFGILLSHTLLALIVLPMIIATIRLALLQSPRHPKLGRITLAIWLYVSITGVVVFWMLRPYAAEHFNNMQSSVRAFVPVNLASTKITKTGDT